MLELELRGLLGDGEHLMLTGPDGQRYQLRVNDALRAAVRRDRPQLEQLRAAGASTLRPKDIQAKIRAGASAEEVAEEAGLPVEHVRRYEGPVMAERTWVVQQARGFHIGRAEDAPVLGDLVVDRLAARGVDTADLEWDAVRRAGKTWEVLVRFEAGDKHREARWHADMTSRAVHALDDESRWLSETEFGSGTGASSGPGTRRHLSPVRVYDVETDGDLGPVLAAVDARVQDRHNPSAHSAAEGAGTSTDDLLAELSASRGVRQELDLGPGFDEDDDEYGPPAAHPPASRPDQARDAHVLAMPAWARRDGDATRPSAARNGGGAEESGSSEGGGERIARERRGGEREASAAGYEAPREDARRPDGADRPGGAGDANRSGSRGAAAADTASAGGPGGSAGRTGAETAGSAPSATDGLKRRARTKGRRTSVPSWDEIVFGAKPE